MIRRNGCAIVRNVESLSALIATFNDLRRQIRVSATSEDDHGWEISLLRRALSFTKVRNGPASQCCIQQLNVLMRTGWSLRDRVLTGQNRELMTSQAWRDRIQRRQQKSVTPPHHLNLKRWKLSYRCCDKFGVAGCN